MILYNTHIVLLNDRVNDNQQEIIVLHIRLRIEIMEKLESMFIATLCS